ncbi:MAG: RsmE family RNA methyltransferase [Gemmatimonadaceae bacterium]|nr:RsmE family RNA methyltransferase [Gemmatimonadaceae bacterium]MCW5825376.1 RsmE family RNA methyltransferase [Gemmatimonadaceae bacterium]
MSLPTFFADEAFAAPSQVTLGEDAAHHMRVRRLEIGARVRLLDGQGTRGEGVLTQLAKRHATVAVEAAAYSEPPAPVHLLLPVADKDRMLWLAEKATELGVASWRPVLYRRSKHVNPRGEGPVFQQKLRARMISALEQSGGSWLPTMYPDASVEHAISAAPQGIALVLDAGAPSVWEVLRGAGGGSVGSGTAAAAAPAQGGISVAVGPEGGFEPAERAALEAAGFRPAALGPNVLRFETAAVAAIAVARAALPF